MSKSAMGAATGFAVGLVFTIVISALTVFLALQDEETVRIGPVATTRYHSSDEVEFDLEFMVGWLGFMLPILGLAAGAAASALLGRRIRE